jgi:hypothetical protein
VPSPVVTSCCVPSPKLNVAFEIVPSLSRPEAVSVIDNGADPEEFDVDKLRHVGD